MRWARTDFSAFQAHGRSMGAGRGEKWTGSRILQPILLGPDRINESRKAAKPQTGEYKTLSSRASMTAASGNSRQQCRWFFQQLNDISRRFVARGGGHSVVAALVKPNAQVNGAKPPFQRLA